MPPELVLEEDDMGERFYGLVTELGFTFAEAGELTFPQILCLQHGGKPPRAGVRTFATMAEVERDRRGV